MSHPFTKKLLRWYSKNPRSMPWKHTRDPYKIWLSEVILQQTRVEQGLPYYNKIIKKFPTVHHLSAASEDEVLKSWEGLGYYTRARNLHAAARQIVTDCQGAFPATYDDILKLIGIGAYSAAAIASFAFNLPHAVVDGNVYRLLSRYFGILEPVDSARGKKLFSELAQELLDKKNPAGHNQAIMNFGALVCKPAAPECMHCIFRSECKAYASNLVFTLPVKVKKNAIRNRWFSFLVLENDTEVIIEKRKDHDIWKGLYQFPVLETAVTQSKDEMLKAWKQTPYFRGRNMKVIDIAKMEVYKLTHQVIHAQFIRVHQPVFRKPLPDGWLQVKKPKLRSLGFPVLITKYLRQFQFKS